MKYTVEQAMEILERTPAVCTALLKGLHDDWVMNNEGPDTFSPFDVLGHLIHGEKTDWVARAKMILESGTAKTFVPWNRFAQYEESKGKTLNELLEEFASVRKANVTWLSSQQLSEADLDKKGKHPALGEVTLRNLLSTWVVHDLTHIAQITRVMAKQYKENMGPWPEFFRILSF
ncbi:MAG: DinB family protein [Bacteroidetes bacterium]|nr:DinB family protein [Bacteroidota bacterium]